LVEYKFKQDEKYFVNFFHTTRNIEWMAPYPNK